MAPLWWRDHAADTRWRNPRVPGWIMTPGKCHAHRGTVVHTEPGMQRPWWRLDDRMVIHRPHPPINDHISRPVARLLEHRHGVDRYAIPLRTAVYASLVGQVIEPRWVLAMPGVWTTGEQEHGDNNQHGPFSTHCCAPCWLLNFGLRPSAGSIPVKNSRLPVCTAST
jgi:hypothetical protein